MTDPDPATTAAKCPTPCDADCEADCHESHEVRYKRGHQPWGCHDIRVAINAKVAEARAAERHRLGAVISPDRFRTLADWFDVDDAFKRREFPNLDRRSSDEVQRDLRKFADLLDDPAPEGCG